LFKSSAKSWGDLDYCFRANAAAPARAAAPMRWSGKPANIDGMNSPSEVGKKTRVEMSVAFLIA
jgi:hypothetical protein